MAPLDLSIWLLHPQGSFTLSTLSHTELLIIPQMQRSVRITRLLYFLFPLLGASFFHLPDEFLSVLQNSAQRSPALTAPALS